LKLPSGTTAERPTSPSTGEWRYNTTTNLVEFWDGAEWTDLQSEDIPPIPSEHFNTVTYTGNGSTQSITGVGFKPDLVWIKPRSFADNHALSDSTRGVNKSLATNTTAAEQTTLGVTSFDADGFSLPNWGNVNQNGATFVAWCWKAGGGTTSSNTDGGITSTVQVNTKARFSIIKYTATASGTQTVGHGLGVAPELIIQKKTSGSEDWYTYIPPPTINSNYNFLVLNSTAATGTTGATVPTSSVFNPVSQSGDYIAYAYASVAGYSSIGSYTGNGSTNGPIVNTGFQPAFVMIKSTSTAGNWVMFDDKRSPSNPRNKILWANLSNAETDFAGTREVNFYSNGFQLVSSGSDDINDNGVAYIYIAFAAEQSTAPVLAESFANRTYSGNSSTQSITGLGFSPNFSWIKVRNNTYVHGLYDTMRGALQRLRSNGTEANENVPNSLTSFDSDGFTLGSDIGQNQSGMNYVAWNWKANPIPTINTDGTIQSVVSANQAAGFSIVKWTGDGSASATVGHGLSGTPDFIMLKDLTDVGSWNGAHVGLASNEGISLNSSAAAFTSMGNNGGITYANLSATNFGFATGAVGVDSVNKNGNNYIAYCFVSISGFSDIGSYTGNGSSQSITTGFQPDWLMFKRTDQNGWYWEIFDTARGIGVDLAANTSAAEQNQSPANRITINTDGFTHTTANYNNISGASYIYMAFKQTQYPQAGTMTFLTIAGGGGGGASSTSAGSGAGGGAGGLRTSYKPTSGGGSGSESDITLAAGTYTITVGSGGGGASYTGAFYRDGNDGSDSSISATGLTTITSIGGGGGGGMLSGGRTGGSGGGRGSGGGYYGAAGTANQGFDGGYDPAATEGGGGGGAASVGGFGTSGQGSGLSVDITGSAVTYATGGNGNVNGGSSSASTANTGDGGQGSGSFSGGASGASGIVVLRLNTSDYSGTTTGSPTITTDGDYTVLQYTGSGTYVHS